MLSKELRTVYETLKELMGDNNGYKVIDADDIISALPLDTKPSQQELSLQIKELKDREYLKIKFFTLEEYCLQVIPKEEELIQLVEEINEAKGEVQAPPKKVKEKVEKVKEKKPFKGKEFLAGFLGSMVGGIIVTIITVVILVVAF